MLTGLLGPFDPSIIWIKTCKKSPLKEARKAYKEREYKEVFQKRYQISGGNVCSELVDCHIQVLQKDINDQIQLRDIYGISDFNGGKDLYLNEPLLGHAVFRNAGHSAKKISKYLQKVLNIKKESIFVEMIDVD